MPTKIKLDRAGILEVLKSAEVASAVEDAAGAIEAHVDTTLSSGEEMDVVSELATPSDRARAVVVLKHPAAQRAEAKHGTLTKAAAAAGFEVKGRAS